ncbi:MAG: oxidoreductase, partial [Mogibacterium sp.]|nr:oxidoreductase [Mogibacterium sp.]
MEDYKKAYNIKAKELAELGINGVPDELQSSKHLIYSSPATLSFNSPGAQGFGVKRAGLAVPGSVMLLVAPACCGRNTTMLAELGQYADRFYYLLQDETDIVTGRHLNRISEAVKEVVDSHKPKPSCVMICITCVDALLGTDMERVCRKASDFAGVPVLPCYMYALEREGRVPPMTAVRKTVYELLEKRAKKSTTVNILGQIAP